MSTDTRENILRACYTFLVPVARFLLRAGISYREFEKISKAAFVRTASDDYGIRRRQTNISRVAAMTGVTRKDIKAIRADSEDYAYDRRVELSPLADILHVWHTNPQFLDERGMPKRLPVNDAARSFELLTKLCASDLPCGALKVELLRCGAVVQDKDGLLTVKRRHVVPETHEKKLVTSLSFSLQALVSTIAFNTDPNREGAGRIERFVESNPVTEASRDRLRTLLRHRISAFTEEVDDVFGAEATAAIGTRARVGVGVFYHEDTD